MRRTRRPRGEVWGSLQRMPEPLDPEWVQVRTPAAVHRRRRRIRSSATTRTTRTRKVAGNEAPDRGKSIDAQFFFYFIKMHEYIMTHIENQHLIIHKPRNLQILIAVGIFRRIYIYEALLYKKRDISSFFVLVTTHIID